MSNLNLLRNGSLDEAREVMDGDIPLDEYELRALVFNLVDTVARLEAEVRELKARPRWDCTHWDCKGISPHRHEGGKVVLL
jgi:hypothetical protein